MNIDPLSKGVVKKTNIDSKERKSDNNENVLKTSYPSSVSNKLGSNSKKDNFIFENNFMKNIKIEDKKIDQSDVDISVTRSNKKDKKFETIESKNENIMKIPKVFQLKYNNLAEKKTQINDNIDKSSSKINSTKPSINNLKFEVKDTKDTEISLLKDKDKSDEFKGKNERASLLKSNYEKKVQISQIMPANKFNSILKQKIDIIDHVPVYLNNETELENSFKINIVSNNAIENMQNKIKLLDSSEDPKALSLDNKNNNNNITQDYMKDISKFF